MVGVFHQGWSQPETEGQAGPSTCPPYHLFVPKVKQALHIHVYRVKPVWESPLVPANPPPPPCLIEVGPVYSVHGLLRSRG